MKKIVLKLTVIILLISSAYAQARTNESLPAPVTKAFIAKYPTASLKKWKLKDNLYVLKYSSDSKNHLAYYDAQGSWLKTETKYNLTYSMPQAVKNAWKASGYASWIIENINEVETHSSHQFVMTIVDIASWDLENRGSQRKIQLAFAMNGSLVKKEEIKQNE